MKQKLTIQFEQDYDGVFARTTVGAAKFSAFGFTPDAAVESLTMKVKHYLNPTEAPQPIEIEI